MIHSLVLISNEPMILSKNGNRFALVADIGNFQVVPKVNQGDLEKIGLEYCY